MTETTVEVEAVPVLQSISKAELDTQIATAKQYPRSIKHFRDECLAMATLSEDIAEQCFYALPRGGQTIEGPSARLAEIVASAWGNCRAGARIVDEDGKFITAQGSFFDLERNVGIQYEVRRRITDKKGRRYNDDMVSVTGNAACSIALRNAVFKGVPKAFWQEIYEAARNTAIGDTETLANRRARALQHFQKLGVSEENIMAHLGVGGREDITIEHLATLTGYRTAIKEGETTPESIFAKPPSEPPKGKTRTEQLASKLKEGKSEDEIKAEAEEIAAYFAGLEERIQEYARKAKVKPMKVIARLEEQLGCGTTSWDMEKCRAADEWLVSWEPKP